MDACRGQVAVMPDIDAVHDTLDARGTASSLTSKSTPVESRVVDVATADGHLSGDRRDAIAGGALDVRVVDRRHSIDGRFCRTGRLM